MNFSVVTKANKSQEKNEGVIVQASYYGLPGQTIRALYPSLPIAMSILRGSPGARTRRPHAGDQQDTRVVCAHAPLTAQEEVSPGHTVTAATHASEQTNHQNCTHSSNLRICKLN